MKMRRIGETGALDRLANLLKRKNAALADQLEQQLNNLSDPTPYAPMEYGGKPMPQVDAPQELGQFEVTSIPSITPGQEFVTISDGAQSIDVDPLIAMDYMQGLSTKPSKEELWEILQSAEVETAMVPEPEEDFPVAEWDQQFTAKKKRAISEEELEARYVERANAERKAGGSIEINEGLPYVAVTLSDGGEYFFQGEEAEDLLNEVPDWIYADDYILAIAQDW